MRNHFLLQSLCSAIIFFSAITVVAQDPAAATASGSIPESNSFNAMAAAQIANLDKSVASPTSSLIGALAELGLVNSETLLEEIQTATAKFKQSKLACGTAADTAEMLCIESKSPQAVIAKGIIDAAGPVLATINSAQKTCSATASTTNLAQQAMTLAKGACVAAKFTCDSSCTKADAELKVINSKIANFITVATAEVNAAKIKYCALGQCSLVTAVVEPSLISFKSVVPPAFATESTPQPTGTMTSLVVRCQGYTKDVVLFATNIFGLLQANKSATECANKLGSGAGSPTAKEYCAITENASTTFCKCQKDTTADGCPGHVATTTSPNDLKDGNGNNIKSAGGANQFAGGFDQIKPTAIDLGGLKPDTVKTNPDDSANPASAGGGGSGTSGGSAGGGSGSAGAGKGSDSKEAVAGEDKKKMGLGSFFGMGGGSSSGSGSGKSGNGSLGQKDMDAIQRQIASEKLRAEVSGASGKSNWEKVSERYLRNKSTLLVGQ